MSVYDTTIIYNPQIEEGGIESEIKKSLEIIERHGGRVLKEDRIGMRRMAYEIANTVQGYYIRVIHEGDGEAVRELERQLRIDEPCLRFLTCLHQGEVPQGRAAAPAAKKPEAAPEPKPEKTPEAPAAESAETEKAEGGEAAAEEEKGSEA